MNDYCLDLVRDHDKDRFLSTLYAPADKQRSLFALYAFKVELSRIRSIVSEPQVGEIRLQWWRDTIEGIFRKQPQDHPLALSLQTVVAEYGLPRQSFDSLIDAHQFDLYADQMPSLAQLEGYLGETESAVIQLACMILSAATAQRSGEAAGLAGVAYGLCRIIASFSAHTIFMPTGMTVDDLGKHALHRLDEAKVALNELPLDVLPCFLHATLTKLYIESGQNFAPWRRQYWLWRSARKNRI
jgi:15-cis-phytoene synthase